MSTKTQMNKRALRRDKFKFPFELSEEQIAIKLGFYFGLLEEGLERSFELHPSDEAKTGADHEYEGILARYYLQAKAPVGLLGTQKVPIDKDREDAGLNTIRKFRADNDLCENPYSLCFPLRRPAKHAKVLEQLQHNLLYAMHDPSKRSYAMYVAPTTYEKEEYLRLLRDKSHREYLHDGPFWRSNKRRYLLNSTMLTEMFMNMPFLQAHICIVPHDMVQSHEHHYSYSVHANDVAFHSPAVLDDVSMNLSDFLARQSQFNSRAADEEPQSIEAVASDLKRSLPESVLSGIAPVENESRISWIKRVGVALKKEYGIDQYLLVKRK